MSTLLRGCQTTVLSAACVLPLGAATQQAPALRAAGTARLLTIAGDGYAGSSVNVVAGLQNTIVTERGVQYAAFYAADGTLVLARRAVGSDAWTTVRTELRGTVADAHNTVAIAVDGAGVLHVAWDHHGGPLNYRRGTAPGSLELGPAEKMTARREDRVTYPSFLRLPDGDLLFLYRDGASGRGDLALNRYDVETRRWATVQARLVNGEGKRSAYASAVLDRKGGLHLAWVWRDSPDVATNHDLAYARSTDGGVTWTSAAGAGLPLPFTAGNADYALRIPSGRSLMNPPSLAIDEDGRPYLASYWAPEGSGVPQYHLVHHDGTAWRTHVVTQRTTPFVLGGTGTKRAPLSRAALFTMRGWRRPREVFLVYRDDERGGRVVVSECRDFAKPADWTVRELTADSVGAWEPSFDPLQWYRFQQVHLLVQHVAQRDGDDRTAADAPPTPVASLVWSPFLAGLAGGGEALPFPPAAHLERPLAPAEVLGLMERAAEYHLAQPAQYHPAGWENAPFLIGALALSKLSPTKPFETAIRARADANEWKPAPRVYDADDHVVIQAYLDLHARHRDPKMLAPSRERLDAVLGAPSSQSLDWGYPRDRDRWSWCDALFMGPTSWLMMAEATGDRRYVDFMNREWWATTDALYVESDRLYARDQSFLDVRERNGRGLYWSRGNGWVAAGLARVLDHFPKDHPDHPRYVALYRDLMEAVMAAQQPDGLWRPGLLDPAAHPVRETSGSSFYTFALAWGVNRGLLDRARVEPRVRRAWNALAGSVTSEGRLVNVQPIGAAPDGFDPHHTEPFGVGAFLLAGSEVYALAGGRPPS
jgi:rhamnogalacturonyl hydrolase YesR